MNFEISFDFIIFETERLLLREFNADDVGAAIDPEAAAHKCILH